MSVRQLAVADSSQFQTDTVLSLRAVTELGAPQAVHYALHSPLTSIRFLLLTVA